MRYHLVWHTPNGEIYYIRTIWFMTNQMVNSLRNNWFDQHHLVWHKPTVGWTVLLDAPMSRPTVKFNQMTEWKNGRHFTWSDTFSSFEITNEVFDATFEVKGTIHRHVSSQYYCPCCKYVNDKVEHCLGFQATPCLIFFLEGNDAGFTVTDQTKCSDEYAIGSEVVLQGYSSFEKLVTVIDVVQK